MQSEQEKGGQTSTTSAGTPSVEPTNETTAESPKGGKTSTTSAGLDEEQP